MALPEWSAFVTAFSTAAPAGVRAVIDDAWRQILRDGWARAHAAWPQLEVTAEAFGTHLGSLVPEYCSSTMLSALHLDSLLLTCACSRGDDDVAIRLFEQRHFPIAVSTLERMRLSSSQIDDVLQVLRAQLFVRSANRPPRIAQYAGRGSVTSWLAVAASRVAFKLLQNNERDVADEDQRLADRHALGGDAELELVRRQLRPLFRETFTAAMGALSERDRTLLRQHYLDGLTLDEVASLYRTHRATAARWLASARQALLDRTRQGLVERLKLPRTECESVIRMARSQLDFTMRSLFAPA